MEQAHVRTGFRVIAFAGTVAALVAVMGCPRSGPAPQGGELTIFCGAGIKPPMDAIKAEFEKAHGATVHLNYQGSGALLGQLQAGAPADLFVPGDTWYIDQARTKDLVESQTILGWFVPVIAVRKGNPKGVKGLADLARADVKVGLGRAEACAVGNTAKALLAARQLADRVKVEYEDTTVNALADQVKLGAVDAAIIWDATAHFYAADLDQVPIEDGELFAAPFGAAVLKQAQNKALAQAFVDLAAGDVGVKAFRTSHYQVPGPTLDVRSGGTMSNPIRDLVPLFERETGRKVLTTFGDSGTLLLETNEAREGDIYVCHDPYAQLAREKGMAVRSYTVGLLRPVIAVAKGNPKGVKGLKDLLREDVKAGLPHRHYSTAGQIIWTSLKRHNLYEQMDRRKPFEARSHGDLGNQVKLGALDAVVMWDAVAKGLSDFLDVLPIEDEYAVDSVTSATTGKTFDVREIKVTVVPLVFAREPLLAAQFVRVATSEAGRAVWAKHGFRVPGQP